MRTAALLALASASIASLPLLGCRSVDVRTQLSQRDITGRPKPLEDADERPGYWRYHVDTASLPGAAPSPSDAHGAGLRVAVTADPGLPGDVDTHEIVERTPVEVPIGTAVWPGRPYACPALMDPMWVGAEVCVSWAIVIEPRGSCAVLVEAVPQVVHEDGCRASLTDLRVRRVLGLDEALVIAVDPANPASGQGAVLVGAAAGKGGRFVIRVRS